MRIWLCHTCEEGEGLAGRAGAVPIWSDQAERVWLAAVQAAQGAVLSAAAAVLDITVPPSSC